MTGALMQLVSHGASDIFRGDPEKSFMKAEYKRHTNFSFESIDVAFDEGVGFGQEAVAVIPRSGDLMARTYLVVDMPEVRGTDVRWVDDVAHAMIESVTLLIGGQVVETQTGEFMHVQNQLAMPAAQKAAFAAMTAMPSQPAALIQRNTLYVPLQLHFCGNPGLSIPLIAIQHAQTQLVVRFRKAEDLLHGTPELVGELSARLAVDFVFADTLERRSIAADYRDNLITQVQHFTAKHEDVLRLNFEHAVKELIFVCQPISNVAEKRYFDFSLDGRNPVRSACLKLNSYTRFAPRPGKYFDVVQPFQHHSNLPSPGVNVYSFALHPEDHAPSGTCNMSRIDYVDLELALEDPSQEHRVSVYAINYNVLWTKGGNFGVGRM